MKLIIVRHGESEANAKGIHQGQRVDVGLSEKGKEQARKVAKRLKDERIDAIYSSDLKRAYETADEIAKEHNLKVINDKRLREFDSGDISGSDLFKFWHEHRIKESERLGISKEEVKMPGGESEKEHLDRIREFLNEIKKYTGTVVISAHGGTNKVFFLALGQANREEAYEIPQGNSAVNIIELIDGNCRVLNINDLSYLGEDSEAVNLFEKVREIPLRMPENLKDEDYRCWGKHRLLKAQFEKAGYKTKFVVCSFNWSEQNLPWEIIGVSHKDEDYHLFLKVRIHGAYFIVDASNDSKLPDFNKWDSLHDCKIAVKPKKIFSFDDSEALEKKELEEFPQRLKENKEFYKKLNGFFEKLRKV